MTMQQISKVLHEMKEPISVQSLTYLSRPKNSIRLCLSGFLFYLILSLLVHVLLYS